MPSSLYRCPITGDEVTGFLVDEAPSVDPAFYTSVRCLSRGQMHLVNFTDGKTVGEFDGTKRAFRRHS
jgi:hypothetical protein